MQASELISKRPPDFGRLLAKDLDHGLGIKSVSLLQELTGTDGSDPPRLGRTQWEVLQVVGNDMRAFACAAAARTWRSFASLVIDESKGSKPSIHASGKC